jgi:hypothetical protein
MLHISSLRFKRPYILFLFFRKVFVVQYIFFLISVHNKTTLISYICYKQNILVCKKLPRDERAVPFMFCTIKMYFGNAKNRTARKLLNIYFTYFMTK